MTRNQYFIGEVCRKTGLTARQVRHWGDIGKLDIERAVCGDISYRVYSDDDIKYFLTVKYYRNRGKSLSTAFKMTNRYLGIR